MERGVATMARGGANIAAPDDATAIYTNPSSLSRLRGLQIMVDGNSQLDDRRFARAADDLDNDGTLTQYDEVNNQMGLVVSPGVFLSYNLAALGLEELTLGAAFFGPLQNDRKWDRSGPQRYDEVISMNRQVYYSLAAGLALPWHGLRVGVSGFAVRQHFNTSLTVTALSSLGGAETPSYDALIAVDATDPAIFGGVLSASIEPASGWTVAASYQPPYNAKAEGTAEVELGDDLDGLADVIGNDLNLRVDLAAIGRLAVRYDNPGKTFDVEAAVQWEQWSRVEQIRFRPQGIRVQYLGRDDELSDINLAYNWTDTWSVRLGGAYEFSKTVQGRAGTFYETAAAPESHRSVSSFDFDKVGVTGGARIDLPAGLWLDLTGAYVHYLTETVDESERLLLDVVSLERLHPVSNGDYTLRQLFLMAALGIEIDV